MSQRFDLDELLLHEAFVRRLARRLVRDEQRAEDLVQDTWVAALERAPSEHVRGWLAAVVRRIWSKQLRAEERRDRRESDAARMDATDVLDEAVAQEESRRIVVQALFGLTDPLRTCLLLRYFEGLPPRRIARRLELPVETVKTRLKRGLEQLRATLDERHGGDRASWMNGVAALCAPVGMKLGSGTLVLGGLAMGTLVKVSAVVLVAAVGAYFMMRSDPVETAPTAAFETADAGQVPPQDEGAATGEAPTPESLRVPLALSSVASSSTAAGTHVLRVILEGISADEAPMATVTLTGVDERAAWPEELRDSWPAQGATSEFDIGPFLADVERHGDLRIDQLEVLVEHPLRLRKQVRWAPSRNLEPAHAASVHEVRVPLARPEFWPEFTLAVRDAHTREHLEGIELRIAPGAGSATWGKNAASNLLGSGLSSPLALMGGRDADQPQVTVAGMALRPATGEAPRLVELSRRFGPERGVIVSARAPGYAWGSTSLDVSQGDRELLLQPAAGLQLSLANVQLERYAALETEAMLCVYWVREDGGNQYVHFERLDEPLVNAGLQLESLLPGGYRVSVELGGGSWTQQPVLALEELSVRAGESRELLLTLDEPPEPPQRATLAGLISFPAPTPTWGEEHVRLQLYFQATQKWRRPDVELSLADLPPVGGPLPSWSFHLEDLPVGMYRVQLMPFLKAWMIELPAEGREDLELVLPELAEVLVETVDGRSGRRLLRDELHFQSQEAHPAQQQRDLAMAVTEEPGLFRFWAAPGVMRVWPKFPNGSEREYGGSSKDFDLVPGFQSLQFELESVHAMRFEFRVDGTTLPTGPQGLQTDRDILAVDHEGRVTRGGLQRDMLVQLSAPGPYEINFEGLDTDLYHPLPPRRVDVHADETTEVIVELRRK